MFRSAIVLAALLVMPAASLAQSTTEHLAGIVTPTIGVELDAQGKFVGAGGTQPATVTREQRGDTTIVTVTPAF